MYAARPVPGKSNDERAQAACMRIFYASDTTAIPGIASNVWRNNLYLPLVDLGHDVIEFAYDLTATFAHLDTAHHLQKAFIEKNRPVLSAELLRQIRAAHSAKPLDMFFSYFYDACITPEVVDEIKSMGIVTVNWFCNSSYQLRLVREIAPHYDWFLFPEKFRIKDYIAIGANPLYCQEAANPAIYKPYNAAKDLDVSFVGQAYGDRPSIIQTMRSAGVNVTVFGPGWNHHSNIIPASAYGGVLSDEDMVKVYSRSKVNVGFSTCGETQSLPQRILQIRLRDFEIPMSGGFYMVEYMEDLEEFFKIGTEIVCYRGTDDLIEKVKYYLAHESERERIRKAGYERAQSDHTWQKRLAAAFAVIAQNDRLAARLTMDDYKRWFFAMGQELPIDWELYEQTSRLFHSTYADAQAMAKEIAAIHASPYWKLANVIKKMAGVLAPQGSLRYAIAENIWNAMRSVRKNDAANRSSAHPLMRLGKSLFPRGTARRVVVLRGLKQFNKAIKAITLQETESEPWDRTHPLMSVIIPCFNYGKYIEEAVDSVLAQTWMDLEIIIVDDGSTDAHTRDVLSRLDRPKTRIIYQQNKKLPAARNNGIKTAAGKYICCLDADDILAPSYLEKCIVKMEYEHLDVCYSNLKMFGDDDAVWRTSDRFLVKTLMRANAATVASVFRRSVWEAVGGYNEHMVMGYEDWDFWLKLCEAGARGAKIDEDLFLYRKHGVSMIDESQKKHDIVFGMLKENHGMLFSDRSLANAIQRKQRAQYRVHNPNMNITAANKPPSTGTRGILFALPYCVKGGADTVLHTIAEHLSSNGFGLTIITTQPIEPGCTDTSGSYKTITRAIYDLHTLLAHEEMWRDFVLYLLETRQIKVIYIVGCEFMYHILPEIRTRFPDIAIVDQLYNDYGHITNNRKYSHLIDINIVENRTIERTLLERYHETKEKVLLIPNGVDADSFSPALFDRANVIATKFPYLKDKFVISFLGRFSEEKAPDQFVTIARSLSKEAEYAFLMGGEGPLADHIAALREKYGLHNRLHLPGFIDVKSALAVTDILVLPSRIDGRPNIVLEALSMGVPVVASRIGGVPEMIHDGENGILCDAEDTNGFINAIRSIMNDADRRTLMRACARALAVSELDVRTMLSSYRAVFERIITSKSRSN